MSAPASATIGGSLLAIAAIGAVGSAAPELAEPTVHLVGVGAFSALAWGLLDVLRQVAQHLGRIASEGLTITVHHEHGPVAGEVGRLADAVARHASATEHTAESTLDVERPARARHAAK